MTSGTPFEYGIKSTWTNSRHWRTRPSCSPACGGSRKRRKRDVSLDLARMQRGPAGPRRQTADPTPTPMLALSATEREPPKGEEPLHWLLLTNRRTRAAGRPLVPDPMGQRNLGLRRKTGSRIKDRQPRRCRGPAKVPHLRRRNRLPCAGSELHGPLRSGHASQPGRRSRTPSIATLTNVSLPAPHRPQPGSARQRRPMAGGDVGAQIRCFSTC